MAYNDDYLIHYGVKGQKWGIRRYQYEDGSLTPEGKEHYNVGEDGKKPSAIKTGIKNAANYVVKKAKEAGKKQKESFVRRHKPVSQMNDQELRENLDRMMKERQYKQIVDEMNGKNKPKKSFGQKHPVIQQVFVNTALSTAASLVSKQLGAKADEILAPRRMERAKEKGMLSKDLFPFVYNNSSRITSYNNNEKAKADAAKVAKEVASNVASEIRKPKKYTLSSVKQSTANKEGIKLAWDGLSKNLNTHSVSDIKPLTSSNSPGVDLILKALQKNS